MNRKRSRPSPTHLSLAALLAIAPLWSGFRSVVFVLEVDTDTGTGSDCAVWDDEPSYNESYRITLKHLAVTTWTLPVALSTVLSSVSTKVILRVLTSDFLLSASFTRSPTSSKSRT